MNKVVMTIGCLVLTSALYAQNADKLQLNVGQKIVFKSSDSIFNQQKRGDESMDMKTTTTSHNMYEVINVSASNYKLTSTLQKIKIDFEGFGQKMVYDSEDPAKQTGMMAEQLKGKLGIADTIELTLDGKMVEAADDKTKGKGKGRGMMRMMDQQSSNIENAFLFVPAEAKEGTGWKKDQTKDGVKSQTIYFVDKLNGNMAEVSFKKKTKGTKVVSSQQGEMNIEVDNLSSGSLVVELKTGLVKQYNEELNSNTKMNMMGQDMPSTGKTTTKIVIE
jgi:hypothetical protein